MPAHRFFVFGTDNKLLDRVALILFFGLIVSLGLVQIRIPVGPIELGLTEVLFVFLLPVSALKFLSCRTALNQKWVSVAIAVYLLTGLLSAYFSISPRTNLKHMLAEIYLALLFFISATLIRDIHKLKMAVAAWLVGAFIASITSLATIALFYIDRHNTLLGFLTYHYGSVPVGNFPRVTATFVSASLYFNYLSVSIVLLLCSRKLGWISRPIYLVGIGLAIVSAIFTFSIGLGSFFLIIALWASLFDTPYLRSKRRLIQFLAMASFVWLALALVTPLPFPEAPFAFKFPGTDFHFFPSARYLVWSDTIRNIASHLLLGVGPGSPVCHVVFTNTDGTVSLLTDAHNTFLNVLAERGAIGALAIIITIVLIIGRRPIRHLYGNDRPLRLVSNGLTFALFIAFVYQGLLGSFEDAKHLWVLMGICVAARELNAENNNAKDSQNSG